MMEIIPSGFFMGALYDVVFPIELMLVVNTISLYIELIV